MLAVIIIFQLISIATLFASGKTIMDYEKRVKTVHWDLQNFVCKTDGMVKWNISVNYPRINSHISSLGGNDYLILTI